MTYDLLNNILDFEEGLLSDDDSLRLFAYLIKTGMAWTLQGVYGRAAESLIDNGIITRTGDINPLLEVS